MTYEAHGCPIRYGLSIFGDRWSLLIIRDLMFKERRFYNEFLDAGEGISTNILADRLARLEAKGILIKTQDPSHGKRFIYSLSDKGCDLIHVMLAIMDWSEKYDEATDVPKDFALQLRKNRKGLEKQILAGIKEGTKF